MYCMTENPCLIGLEWLRDTYKYGDDKDIQGVVYFGDDDNLYDVRLFDEVKHINMIVLLSFCITDS